MTILDRFQCTIGSRYRSINAHKQLFLGSDESKYTGNLRCPSTDFSFFTAAGVDDAGWDFGTAYIAHNTMDKDGDKQGL